jgi:hypothetical protein
MRVAFALFAGLAAASPLGNLETRVDGIRINGLSAFGSGCPDGRASIQLDASGTIFDVAFDQYTVQTGPGFDLSEARKNCRLSFNLEFPTGYQ